MDEKAELQKSSESGYALSRHNGSASASTLCCRHTGVTTPSVLSTNLYSLVGISCGFMNKVGKPFQNRL